MKIKQFFQDKKGEYSSMRLVVFITAIYFFATWSVQIIMTYNFTPSTELVAIFTSVVVAKVAQTFSE